MPRAAVIPLLVALGIVFGSVVIDHSESAALPPLAEAYVEMVPRELGAPNVITGILLTYRAFDTLGEVAVLFMVAAGIGLLLGGRPKRMARTKRNRPPPFLLPKSCATAPTFSFRS